MTSPVRTEDKLLALGAHLSWVVALPLLVPFVLYLVKRDDPFVRHHAAEALNFHLTLLLYSAISVVLLLVLIGFVLLAALGVLVVVCSVLACVAVADGRSYRYPLTLHMVR